MLQTLMRLHGLRSTCKRQLTASYPLPSHTKFIVDDFDGLHLMGEALCTRRCRALGVGGSIQLPFPGSMKIPAALQRLRHAPQQGREVFEALSHQVAHHGLAVGPMGAALPHALHRQQARTQ